MIQELPGQMELDVTIKEPDELEIQRGTKYALITLVAEYETHEWQERYLCVLDEIKDNEVTIEAIRNSKRELQKGKLVKTVYGTRLKIDQATVWFCYKALRFSEAQLLAKMKVLPFFRIKKLTRDKI